MTVASIAQGWAQRWARACAALALMVLLSACSTPLGKARLQYAAGDAQGALATLGDGEGVRSRDKLLFYLEKGLILHETGDYAASTRELLAAADSLEQGSTISLSGEATALLANDWARRYPGEYSEQLWVHSYLMMNFLAMGRFDSAAVEARRALEKIDDKSEVLAGDHFTRNLIALSFEAAGQINSAFIEYRKLADQLPSAPLDNTLLSQARALGFADEVQRLRKAGAKSASGERPAELVLFVASGNIPRKISSSLQIDYDARVSFPQYLPYDSEYRLPQVHVDAVACHCEPISRTSLGALARASLGARAAGLTTRLVARAVAKDALADNVGKKDEVAGEIVKLLLFALEEADTRGWHSLPGYLSLIRVPLDDNASEVVVGDPEFPQFTIDVSDLRPGQSRFVPLRL